MNRKNRKAFTIVELVIVIAVIAILAGVITAVFSNVVKKANESADMQLIRNLNTALATDAVINGKHGNMTEALEAVGIHDPEELQPKTQGDEILWDQENDVFCFLKDEKLVYAPDVQNKLTYFSETPGADNPNNQNYKLWKIGGDEDVTAGIFSVYYTGQADELNITTGVDVGTSGVTTVNYARNSENARTVIVRTVRGSLNVNAPKDSVYHYGSAVDTEIRAVAAASYHECGTSVFLKAATGRIVLTEDARIGGIHVMATESGGNQYFNSVILKLEIGAQLPSITRDDSDIDNITASSSSGTFTQYFFELQNANGDKEHIWLEAKVEGGTLIKSVKVTETEPTDSMTYGTTEIEEKESPDVLELVANAATPKDEATAKGSAESEYQSNASFVAKIVNICYETIKEALSVAGNATVTVLQDCGAEFVPNNVTIDGGGHTLTLTSNCSAGTITLAGNLVINLNGKTVNAAGDGFIVGSGKKLTVTGSGGQWNAGGTGIQLSGGTVEITGGGVSAVGDGLTGYGTVTITGGLLESTEGSAIKVTGTVATTVKVSGGEVTGYDCGIDVDYNATGNVTISGTAVISATGAVSTCRAVNYPYNSTAKTYSKGTLTISGGTLKNDSESGAFVVYYYTNAGSLKVTGGTYIGASGIYYSRATAVTISGINVTVESNTANYGIYNGSAKKLTVTNSTINVTGNSVTSTGIRNNKAGTVEVGTGTEVSVTSSATAYGVNNVSTGTVTVSAGTVSAKSTAGSASGVYNTSTGTVNLSGGKVDVHGSTTAHGIYNASTGKVNLSGGSVSVNTSGTYAYGVYNVKAGTVTISGGSLQVTSTGNNVAYGVCNKVAGTILMTGGEINVNGSTTTAKAAYGIFNTTTGPVTLESGTITVSSTKSTATGIYNKAGATVTVSGGKIAASSTASTVYGIWNNAAGIINFTDGTIEVNATTAKKYSYLVYNYSTGPINISGGSFTATSTLSSYKKIANKADGVTITGGTFNIDPSNYVAEGCTVTPNKPSKPTSWTVTAPTS